MTVLEDLFFGNIEIHGRIAEKNSKLSELIELASKNNSEFRKYLPDELIEKFDAYSAYENQLNADFECEAFVYGFSLRLRISFESFNKNFSD